MADFTSAEVEDGTGQTTSVVYSTIADAVAATGFLVLRGLTSLSGEAVEATQKAAMFKATDRVEEAVREFIKGVVVTAGQGLIWPLDGAYDSQATLIANNVIPVSYLNGWLLACEKFHSGALVEGITLDPRLASERSATGAEMKYRDSDDDGGVAGVEHANPVRNDPEIWRLLRRSLPPELEAMS